ncbi:MAG: hypothetical protein LBB48_05270 [Treponema sp.]|jgi:hypothetical protein|nr:hypothetical protein [Treponema sp.]
MKKFFIAFLAFALAAGNLFAEVTISGSVLEGVQVIGGSTQEDSDITAGHSLTQGRLWATFSNDEGTFGGLARVQGGPDGAAFNARLFGWWQPISQLRLTLGQDGNGQFGVNYVVGWGFHANDAEDYVAYNGYGFTRNAWAYAGFDVLGATLSIKPIDGLAINLAIPYTAPTAGVYAEAARQYNHIHAQAVYAISGIGEIAVTFTGSNNEITVTPKKDDPTDFDVSISANAIYGQFFLTAVENLSLNIGLKYTLPVTTEFPGIGDATYNTPIGAGFGVAYAVSDTFGVKARLAATFAGSKEQSGTTIDDPFHLGFDLMPYFDLSILKIFVNLGLEYTAAEDAPGAEAIFGWYLNPYITKTVGGGTFYAGFQLSSDGTKTAGDDLIIKWSIPVGLQVAF